MHPSLPPPPPDSSPINHVQHAIVKEMLTLRTTATEIEKRLTLLKRTFDELPAAGEWMSARHATLEEARVYIIRQRFHSGVTGDPILARWHYSGGWSELQGGLQTNGAGIDVYMPTEVAPKPDAASASTDRATFIPGATTGSTEGHHLCYKPNHGLQLDGCDQNHLGRAAFAQLAGFKHPSDLYAWINEKFGGSFDGFVEIPPPPVRTLDLTAGRDENWGKGIFGRGQVEAYHDYTSVRPFHNGAPHAHEDYTAGYQSEWQRLAKMAEG